MKFKYIFCLGILFLRNPLAAQPEIMNRLTANLNETTIHQKVTNEGLVKEFLNISDKGRFGGAEEIRLFLEVNSPDADIDWYIRTQKADGSWPDIDYTDKNNSSWSPKLHAIRFQVLAKAYQTASSRYYKGADLAASLHRAMAFWFKEKPVCPNWWYNDIGIPMYMGPGFLLLKDELTSWEKTEAQRVMNRKVYKATGQNKVWDAGKDLMQALLTDNLPLAVRARDSIVSEIYVTSQEGLQPDYSFHQHGAQMQFGNYGLSYISSMAYWARIFAGTSLSFDSKRIQYLCDYILKGIQWTVWKGYMDPGACGRQVFQNAERSKSFVIAIAALNMMRADPLQTHSFDRLIRENLTEPQLDNTLTGHKHFWRSDYAIHRSGGWFASVRMNSVRTKGVEMTNRENLQGFYAADGVMSVLVDGDEYNNIFPIWDWRRLPGLTVQDNVVATVDYSERRSDFTGGLGEGENGVSSTIVKHDGLTAYKSYFFLNHMIICMGAGISSEKSLPVFTSLNQPILKGEITYFSGRNNLASILPAETEISQKDIKAVLHHRIGYYMFLQDQLHISNKSRLGNWNQIADFYKNIADSGKLFSLFIEHGATTATSKYAYGILPDITKVQLVDFIANPSVKILSNTISCQAVTNVAQTICEAVFYSSGELIFGSQKLISGNAGILMIEQIGKGKLKITVADPTQKMEKYELYLSGKYEGRNMVYDIAKDLTCISIALPEQIGYRGKPVSMEIESN